MTAPSTLHQQISMGLGSALNLHFRGRTCRVFAAPTDVRLSEHDVAQPDLMVVCDKAQIQEGHIDGPPTLVAEILSPSSLRHDRIRKSRLYAACGVKEYWIVNPSPAMVEVYLLDGQTYRLQAGYTEKDTLLSPTFPDLAVELAEVFPDEEVDEVRESAAPPYLESRA